jgi:hypothetical protein
MWRDGGSARNREMNKRVRVKCRAGRAVGWVVLAIASNDQEARTRTGLIRCTSPPAWERAFLYKRQARRVTTEVESRAYLLLRFTPLHLIQ